jgi:hypothetical protein
MQLKKITSAILIIFIACLVVINSNTGNSAHNVYAEAAYPSTISFSGYTWYVENGVQRVNLGLITVQITRKTSGLMRMVGYT